MTSVALKTFSFTEEGGSFPGFVNISRWPDGTIKLIVRSSPKDGKCGLISEIVLSSEVWQEAVKTVR